MIHNKLITNQCIIIIYGSNNASIYVGNIYTGLVDGRIIKINMNLQSFKTIIRTGKDSDECKKGKSYLS